MVVKSIDITRDKKDNEKRKQCEEQHVLIPLPYHTPAVLYPVNSFYWWDMYLDNLQFTSNICHLTAGDIIDVKDRFTSLFHRYFAHLQLITVWKLIQFSDTSCHNPAPSWTWSVENVSMCQLSRYYHHTWQYCWHEDLSH